MVINMESLPVGLSPDIFVMSHKIRCHLKSPLAPQPSYRQKGFCICSLIGHGWLATGQELLQTKLTPHAGDLRAALRRRTWGYWWMRSST